MKSHTLISLNVGTTISKKLCLKYDFKTTSAHLALHEIRIPTKEWTGMAKTGVTQFSGQWVQKAPGNPMLYVIQICAEYCFTNFHKTRHATLKSVSYISASF